MTSSGKLSVLILLLLGLFVFRQAFGQAHSQVPSQRTASVQDLSDVATHTVSPDRDNAALRADAPVEPGTPYKFGKVLQSDLSPSESGTWEELPTGDQIWRLRLRSQEARSISLGFRPFSLPEDAQLYVYAPDGSTVHGPYDASDATNGQHRTPLVQSDEIVVELVVPADARSALNLRLDRIVHGFRSMLPSQQRSVTPKSQSCNVDVTCAPGWTWGEQIRSVGRITFEVDGSVGACTGALVNNTAGNERPFFLTAEHCVSSPDVAETMVFYWNYQNPTCRRPGSGESGRETRANPLDETSSGAVMRARYGNVHVDGEIGDKPDLTLVEIDDTLPAEYDLYLSGWDRSGSTTDQSVSIHHPAADGKRISVDRDPTVIRPWGLNGSQDTHLRIQNWDRGTTEQGSSGSPLFDVANERIVGVLSGGIPGEGCDQSNPDFYGRLSLGFENGDYRGNTLADWLDPVNTNRTTLGGRDLSPDSIPPSSPQEFRVEQASSSSTTLSWTAPGDDGTNGTAARYALRYQADGPITDFESFRDATPVRDLPQPKAPGTRQSVTVDLERDTTYYFAIVAFDDVFQRSGVVSLNRTIVPVSGLRLLPPAPNPTRTQATATVAVDEQQRVRVTLYDALGREVSVLLDDQLSPFRRRALRVDAASLSSGVYFLRAKGESSFQTQKIVVVQ